MIGLLVLLASTEVARLPFPEERIPEEPALQPTVVTAKGARRFIAEFPDLQVGWDGKRFYSNYRDWWIINYPMDRIRVKGGGSFGEVERCKAFGERTVKNWYLRVPGSPRPEPSEPQSPAPIRLHPDPAVVVDPTGAVRTISEALKIAGEGDVIRVRYGIYREEKLVMSKRGVTLEGERDGQGRLPVLSGNRLFPPNAWKRTRWPGVWSADVFTGLAGSVSLDGVKLRERDFVADLQGGDYCFSRASETFAGRRDAPGNVPFHRVKASANGLLDVASGAYPDGCVRYGRTWVWVDPKERTDRVVWDPNCPLPVTGTVRTEGEFRIGRQNGSPEKTQVNAWRVAVNGEWIPAYVYATADSGDSDRVRAHLKYGRQDAFQPFTLKEGWNRLDFVFDTTRHPDKTTFSFPVPKGIDSWQVSAENPVEKAKAGSDARSSFITEMMLSDPVAPGAPCRRVFLKLADGSDPNRRALDLSFTGVILSVRSDFCKVRGLEFRHGAQYQQTAHLSVDGEGNLVEFCQSVDSMVRGVSVRLAKNQLSAPNVVRGCRIIRPGNTGIGAASESRNPLLTAENQSTTAEGRSRCILEYNYVCDANWGGYQALWESGGIKACNLTGSVIRYNTIERGMGPGIWLDWQNYNNRIEGNLGLNCWGFLVGIEASPGPNLVCNNVSINQRPGGVWFRSPFLAWSTGRYWCLWNSVDGRYNDTPSWKGMKGAGSIDMDGGNSPADRRTRWIPLPEDRGCLVAHNSVTNLWTMPEPSFQSGATRVDSLVAHDFYGLIRRQGDRRQDGAFREDDKAFAPVLEVEYLERPRDHL